MSPSFPPPHPFSNGKSKESRTPAKKFRDRGEQGHKTVLRGIARRGDTETKAPTLGRVSSSYRKNAVKERESSAFSASPRNEEFVGRNEAPDRNRFANPLFRQILYQRLYIFHPLFLFHEKLVNFCLEKEKFVMRRFFSRV